MASTTIRIPWRAVSPDMLLQIPIAITVVGFANEWVDITCDENDVMSVHNQLKALTGWGASGTPPESSSAAGRAMPARTYRTEVFSGSATVTADVESAHLSSGWTTGTLTLPALSAVPVGHRVVFCDAHGRLLIAVRTLTIAGNGSDTINGASSVSAARTYCRLVVEATAGGWAVNSNLL